jgi:transposase-like protein
MATRYSAETKAEARRLRAEGMSVAGIARDLGVQSTSVVQRWVADIPPPEWTRRPNAKDELRAKARSMRGDGASLKQIAAALGVATSSVSVWVRDMPTPDGLAEGAARAAVMRGARWRKAKAARERERQAVKAAAEQVVGQLSARELLLLGVILYWAEGSKDKPYDRREFVALINRDVSLINLFLRWLDLLSVPEEDRRYRLSIHETADLDVAHEFWVGATGIPLERFSRPTLKRHNVTTKRLNVADEYYGCMIVSVCKSRVLYQRIDGLFRGITHASQRLDPRPEQTPDNVAGPSAVG